MKLSLLIEELIELKIQGVPKVKILGLPMDEILRLRMKYRARVEQLLDAIDTAAKEAA